ncbi:hypothetical protein LSM04_008962 [Trypanosoma melophagium]|uniref:uncharacterized protein n=1 Tax=Trypanosoma melophagium TaxID=715481 RepID=UPI00351A8444|nr:hypothetical protein LSM04_008962 [Trypanosoma melophagium]
MYKDDGMRSQKTISGSSNGASCGESSARSLECVETPRGSLINIDTISNESPVAYFTPRVWSQLHVMEIALSTNENNFIHITQRFVQYEAMYPIVYRCDLRQLIAPHEGELLTAPTTGLQTSRFWSCRLCGKAHDVVRETCVRCRRHSSGPFTKLFFGQIIKEKTDCARSVLRLLYATHPGITIHSIEAHQNENGRGLGCASVYVSTDALSELISKLNGNVFFDTNHTSPSSLRGHQRDDGMDGFYVYYVYSSQQPWLEALIAARTSQRHRINTMPWGGLVVEDSKGNRHNTGESTITTTKKTTRKKSGGKILKTTIIASRSSPTDLQISE